MAAATAPHGERERVLPNGWGLPGRVEHGVYGVGTEGVERGGNGGQGGGEVRGEFRAVDADQCEVIADVAADLSGGAQRPYGVFVRGSANGGDLRLCGQQIQGRPV
jgi:hypothetical protein